MTRAPRTPLAGSVGVRCLASAVLILVSFAMVPAQQTSSSDPLAVLAATERAFARRATEVGWKQAFLDYFADDAIAFQGEEVVAAKAQLREIPDPPPGVQLLWEPRFGDIAASGELGWLTGPSTTINPARNNGEPRHGTYASVWKRQADGRYMVIIDVGVNTPAESPFPSGFTRAPAAERYRGADTAAAAAQTLRTADTALNMAARRGQAGAYQTVLAEGARLHRNGILPLTTSDAAVRWLNMQPNWTAGDIRDAEVAASSDLGYTYGTYAMAAAGSNSPEKGFYTRVWVRLRDGGWRLALDVLQPQ